MPIGADLNDIPNPDEINALADMFQALANAVQDMATGMVTNFDGIDWFGDAHNVAYQAMDAVRTVVQGVKGDVDKYVAALRDFAAKAAEARVQAEKAATLDFVTGILGFITIVLMPVPAIGAALDTLNATLTQSLLRALYVLSNTDLETPTPY